MKPQSVRDVTKSPVGRAVLLLAVLSAQWGLERVASVKTAELWGFRVLQRIASALRTGEPDGVVLVDISQLRQKDGITPREPLIDLLSTLEKSRARAVAIDIDFSPEDSLFVDPKDPVFFEECK